ncbi:MAG: APC family permease [Parvibaculaceae bacterium]
MVDATGGTAIPVPQTLQRSISWTHAFWFAAGTPALVLFSIGAIAATVGNVSPLIWFVSILFGFLQSFTYAEIASMYPHKSGGASVYGAIAWVRYGKLLGPISVWSNWFSWSPVLAIGTGLGAGYILTLFFAPESPVHTWEVTVLSLAWISDGLTLRINATFLLGWVLVLAVFAIQHGGVLKAARAQMIMAVIALLPLLIIGILPILRGEIPLEHYTPFVPLAYDAESRPIPGAWDIAGLTVFAGGLFIAGWSTYAFETAICYTREFKEPARDTFRAIFAAGLLCVAVFTLVPFAFQGALGLTGMLDPGIYSGMGVAKAMAGIVGGGAWVEMALVILLIISLLLTVSMAMAGSARTLYQGSVDGWLPRYLSHVNENGAPTAAMWTDLCFNMLLLMMSNYVFLLAIANVNYMIFIFMNLQSGWLHRIDRPASPRPYRAPNILLAVGALLGFVNLFVMGMGANIWGQGTLTAGIVVALMIIPVFLYRHYVQDKGVFPEQLAEDMRPDSADEARVQTRAGLLPYVVLAGGIACVLAGYLVSA